MLILNKEDFWCLHFRKDEFIQEFFVGICNVLFSFTEIWVLEKNLIILIW